MDRVRHLRQNNPASGEGRRSRAPLLPSAAALALLCILAAMPLRAQSPDVERAFERGAAAMRAGNAAEAETAFREALRLAPDVAVAHLDLGLVLGREGKLDEAITSIRDAVRLDSTLEGAHMFLGIFLHQANHQDEARTELQQEIDQHPKNAEALTWLGAVELAAGRPERAVGPYDRAFELEPDNLDLLEARGRAHNLVARDSYARMARLDPNSWHVHRVQAQLFADEGRHAEAIAEYEAAIKVQQRSPDLYEGVGDEYRKLNQMDAAHRAYAKELELSPQNVIAMYDLGSTDVEMGDNKAAIPLLSAMTASYPGSPVAEYYLGRALAADGRDAEAIPWLEKSAAADPAGEVGKRSWFELARAYRKTHRLPEAQKAIAQYNRMREAQESANAKAVEDWRKLGVSATPPSAPSN